MARNRTAGCLCAGRPGGIGYNWLGGETGMGFGEATCTRDNGVALMMKTTRCSGRGWFIGQQIGQRNEDRQVQLLTASVVTLVRRVRIQATTPTTLTW
jgi:hypothetical protein